ncbi:hypothetical protein J2X90_005929 [Variovorax paradoxus]|uniref:integrase catalytic domain-containing protein n=1 Tax=Variovorax paradoxus TaxID=34073 RepID=UPI002786B835|nr:transposase family protein [Variovorax paradoxus]MDQ0028076.1 hypothetical protein [Variovorax paradoxus]
MKVMIPALLPAMVRHGRINDDPGLHAQLLAVSAATIDRLLASLRIAASKGRRRAAGQSSAVRRAVPIRTFGDWDDPAPGYLEVDFVAHCGPQLAGNFIQTLVLTDVATGWTECVPVLTRDSTLVIDAIDRARALLPFPMLGVDFDNDSVFMNERVVGWCRAQGLEVTRARAYRKNDQAWVEQKNGAIVRRLVGYGRFEGLESLRVLTRLYAAARIHTNVLQPSFKLRSKSRIGAKVVKRYHPPLPPANRVLAHDAIGAAPKRRLGRMLATADPVVLLNEIRAAQEDLGRRVDQRGVARVTESAHEIISAPAPVTAAQRGEQRAIHRRPYRRIKPVPRKPRMLDAYEDHTRNWLQRQPGMTAVEILDRLRELAPAGTFKATHLRTVQRALATWRAEAIRQWIDQCRAETETSASSAAEAAAL